MEDKFEPLKPDEVVSLGKDFKADKEMFYLPLTFKAEEVHINIAQFLIGYNSAHQEIKKKLFNEGFDAEALKFGADGWQKGTIKFRVAVEFCPDEPEEVETPEHEEVENGEPESPLDDLRQELNQ